MWTAKEEERLKELTLSTVRNSPEKLIQLVQHFQRNGSVFAVTDAGKPIHVSADLARKVRDLTREGKLDWVLERADRRQPTSDQSAGQPAATREERLPQSLIAEIKRLIEAVGDDPRESWLPTDSLQKKIHQALRDCTRDSTLPGLLDAHERAWQHYHSVCMEMGEQLQAKVQELALHSPSGPGLLHPWDQHLIRTFHSRTWHDRPGEILPEGRQYSPAPNGVHTGDFTPQWGAEFSLTTWNISGNDYPWVLQSHMEYRSFAEQYLSGLAEATKNLKETAHHLKDELERMIVADSLAD